METIKKALDKILQVIGIILFIAMVLLTTYQVVSRYVFNHPSSISEILTRYSFVWLILVSATYVFGQRDHISIAYIRDKFTGKARKIIEVIIEVIIIIFALTIMVYGGSIVTHMNMLQYDSMLDIPTGIIYSVIPICGVLTIFYCIYNIIKIVASHK